MLVHPYHEKTLSILVYLRYLAQKPERRLEGQSGGQISSATPCPLDQVLTKMSRHLLPGPELQIRYHEALLALQG